MQRRRDRVRRNFNEIKRLLRANTGTIEYMQTVGNTAVEEVIDLIEILQTMPLDVTTAGVTLTQ